MSITKKEFIEELIDRTNKGQIKWISVGDGFAEKETKICVKIKEKDEYYVAIENDSLTIKITDHDCSMVGICGKLYHTIERLHRDCDILECKLRQLHCLYLKNRDKKENR